MLDHWHNLNQTIRIQLAPGLQEAIHKLLNTQSSGPGIGGHYQNYLREQQSHWAAEIAKGTKGD